MRIVVAIDSFKGCLTSKEANLAATEGIKSICPNDEVVQVPVSDGGEGFMEAFHAAIGGKLVEITVRDPLMRPVSAKYLFKEKLAVIEIAQASGLTLLTQEERDPMVTTSYGTGQLVADAVRQTFMGKLPMGILQQSGEVPVCLIAGRISDKQELLNAGFTHVECINSDGITLEEAMRKEVATRNISNTVSRMLLLLPHSSVSSATPEFSRLD